MAGQFVQGSVPLADGRHPFPNGRDNLASVRFTFGEGGRPLGTDFGTEIPATPVPDATVVPEVDLRTTTGGKVEVVSTKGVFDGVKLEFDLGTAGQRTDIDLRPNYTLNWLPPAGTSAIIKVPSVTFTKARNTATGAPGSSGR